MVGGNALPNVLPSMGRTKVKGKVLDYYHNIMHALCIYRLPAIIRQKYALQCNHITQKEPSHLSGSLGFKKIDKWPLAEKRLYTTAI